MPWLTARADNEAFRSFSRLGLRRDGGPGDQVMELVAARYAQLGIGLVQVEDDGAGRQEQPVGDLGVGQPAAGEKDDLALVRCEAGERAGCCQRGRGGHAAGAQFRLRAPGPGRVTEAAERLQGRREDGFGVVDRPLPPQPLP